MREGEEADGTTEGLQRNKRRRGVEKENTRKKQKSADDAEIVLVDSNNDCATIVDDGDKAANKDSEYEFPTASG